MQRESTPKPLSHHMGVITALEYPDLNPHDPAVAHAPRRAADPQLYINFCATLPKSSHMYCAAFQPQLGQSEHDLHIQFYYADTRRRPTLGQQLQMWGLRPWQYRVFSSRVNVNVSERAAWDFSTRPENLLPGGTPRTFGEPPVMPSKAT